MDSATLLNEIIYATSRSGGKGGQNVNKVETKVEARVHIGNSAALTEREKTLVREKCSTQISQEDYLIVTNQTDRSQLGNKEKATKKLLRLITKSLIVPKKRKPSVMSASARAKKAADKTHLSEKKSNRRWSTTEGSSHDE